MKMRAAVMYGQGLPRPYAESKPFVIEDGFDRLAEGSAVRQVLATHT